MNNIQNIPDKKLYIGAKIGFITNIINIIWSIIIAILLIAGQHTDAILSDENRFFTVKIIIGVLITIGLSIAIIIACNNILKGKTNSGLVVGILTLVLAGLSLISIFWMGFNFVSMIDFVFLGLNIASGVLLIIGKYLPASNSPEEVVSIVNE